MLTNIVDNRDYRYKFTLVDAIVEATWHDNTIENADQSEHDNAPDYDERSGLSVNEAFKWAESLKGNVTLYLYDLGQNKRIYTAEGEEIA